MAGQVQSFLFKLSLTMLPLILGIIGGWPGIIVLDVVVTGVLVYIRYSSDDTDLGLREQVMAIIIKHMALGHVIFTGLWAIF